MAFVSCMAAFFPCPGQGLLVASYLDSHLVCSLLLSLPKSPAQLLSQSLN